MFFKVYVIVGVVVCEYRGGFFKVYVIVGVVVCEYVL